MCLHNHISCMYLYMFFSTVDVTPWKQAFESWNKQSFDKIACQGFSLDAVYWLAFIFNV